MSKDASRGELRISDARVRERTGKDWRGWFRTLDRAGVAPRGHKGIVAWLEDRHPDLGAWWTQTVAVGYEQSRGLRAVHQKADGFEIGRSKTVNVPVAKLYRAWRDVRSRRRFLGEDAGFTVRKATPEKYLRATWVDGASQLNLTFWSKGDEKSMVEVRHGRLEGPVEAEGRKAYWGEVLARMKLELEGVPPGKARRR